VNGNHGLASKWAIHADVSDRHLLELIQDQDTPRRPSHLVIISQPDHVRGWHVDTEGKRISRKTTCIRPRPKRLNHLLENVGKAGMMKMKSPSRWPGAQPGPAQTPGLSGRIFSQVARRDLLDLLGLRRSSCGRIMSPVLLPIAGNRSAESTSLEGNSVPSVRRRSVLRFQPSLTALSSSPVFKEAVPVSGVLHRANVECATRLPW